MKSRKITEPGCCKWSQILSKKCMYMYIRIVTATEGDNRPEESVMANRYHPLDFGGDRALFQFSFIPEGWLEIDKHYSLELCFSIDNPGKIQVHKNSFAKLTRKLRSTINNQILSALQHTTEDNKKKWQILGQNH